MSVVNGKDVILSINKGASYYPIACNATCTLKFQRDIIETTFRDSSDIRQFIPGKAVLTLDGTGPIEYDAGFSPADVVDYAYSGLSVNWTFELADNKGHTPIVKTYSGTGFFSSFTLTGDVQQAASCDYTIQVNGDITGSTDPGLTPPTLQWPFYDAVGGEVTLSNADWIDAEMVEITRNGIVLVMIYTGTPTGNQVLVDNIAGTITFDAALPLSFGEYIQTIFVG